MGVSTLAPTAETSAPSTLFDNPGRGDFSEVEVVFHGKREVARLDLATPPARGHALPEAVPGVCEATLGHTWVEVHHTIPGPLPFGSTPPS